MIVVNLYAGSGAGKSTVSAGVFYKLKMLGYNCELAGEFAKELVYDESYNTIKDQIYLFGVQNHRLRVLAEKCDIVVCDSPLLLNCIYANESPAFKELVFYESSRYRSLNFFLNRDDSYWTKSGRIGTLDSAKEADARILSLLHRNNIPFDLLESNEESIETIAKAATVVLKKIRKGSDK